MSIFNIGNVKKIELGLINACVLSCPMCLRLEDHGKKLKPGLALNYEKLTFFLDKFSELETLDLIGSVSEPMLYPKILDLVRYAKNRKISLRIGTNANVHNRDFWIDLANLLDKNDIVRFAIDGSNQEIHQTYRVGGNLKRVLETHALFKQHSGAVTILQHLVFQHNRDDFKNIEKLFLENGFDFIEKIESGEPAYLNQATDGLIMPRCELVHEYRKVESKLKENKLYKFDCFAKTNDQMYINHLGNLLPCDDMEELSFEMANRLNSKIPTIYESSIEECFEFANEIIKKRYLSDICRRCCSSEVMELKKQFPVLQSKSDLQYKPLTIFRGVVDVK